MQPKKPSDLSQQEREQIVHFMQAHPVCVLGTVDTNGDPYTTVIYFSIDDNLRLTFTTKRETHKYKNIAHHDVVALVVYDASTQTTVQVRGRAVEVTGPGSLRDIYAGTLRAAEQTSVDNVPPIAKVEGNEFVGFSIEIDTISMIVYGHGDNFANALKHAKDTPPSGDPA